MSIRQNRFRNQQGDTCSYYNRFIKSIFIVLFKKLNIQVQKKTQTIFSDSQVKKKKKSSVKSENLFRND